MKKYLSLLALPIIALGLAGCDHHNSALDLPPGQYNKTTSSTDANGVSTDNKTTTSVGYDANGNKKATVTNKKDVDPPGLFNKSTTQSTTTMGDDQ